MTKTKTRTALPAAPPEDDGLPAALPRVPKYLIEAAAGYTRLQIRAVVDLYMNVQKLRVGARNRESAIERMTDCGDSTLLLTHLKGQLEAHEKDIAKCMARYVNAQPLGRWAVASKGVGDICVAALLAHVDFGRCTCRQFHGVRRDWKAYPELGVPDHPLCRGLATAGAIHRFCGQVDKSELRWEKGEVRPYNARLSKICYQLGASISKQAPAEGDARLEDDGLAEKVSAAAAKKGKLLTSTQVSEEVVKKRGRYDKKTAALPTEEYLYVRLYYHRKRREEQLNESGQLAEAARNMLRRVRPGLHGPTDAMKKVWQSGKLQAGGLERRAARYAVKMFLSHFHEVGYFLRHGILPPVPYILGPGGHSGYVPPPHLELVPGFVEAKKEQMKKLR